MNRTNLELINNSLGINNKPKSSLNTSKLESPEYNTYLLKNNDYSNCFSNLTNNIGKYSKYKLFKTNKSQLRNSLNKCSKIRSNNKTRGIKSHLKMRQNKRSNPNGPYKPSSNIRNLNNNNYFNTLSSNAIFTRNNNGSLVSPKNSPSSNIIPLPTINPTINPISNNDNFCNYFSCKDTETLKKCYRRNSLKGKWKHPDKGGNTANFAILSKKYNNVENKGHSDNLCSSYVSSNSPINILPIEGPKPSARNNNNNNANSWGDASNWVNNLGKVSPKPSARNNNNNANSWGDASNWVNNLGKVSPKPSARNNDPKPQHSVGNLPTLDLLGGFKIRKRRKLRSKLRRK